jgi:hypothetical protein
MKSFPEEPWRALSPALAWIERDTAKKEYAVLFEMLPELHSAHIANVPQ